MDLDITREEEFIFNNYIEIRKRNIIKQNSQKICTNNIKKKTISAIEIHVFN